MNTHLEPKALAHALAALHQAGVLRVKETPTGAVAVARPEGHQVTTQCLLNLQDARWRDMSSRTNGRGYFALCRRLGVPLEIATQALLVR